MDVLHSDSLLTRLALQFLHSLKLFPEDPHQLVARTAFASEPSKVTVSRGPSQGYKVDRIE
jgi:hypothetical protein